MNDGLWDPRGRTARALVLGAMGINLAASLGLALVLRDATAAGGAASERMAFILDHSLLVSAFWYAWVPASLGLLVVIVTVLRSLRPAPGPAGLVLLALVLGAVPDIVNNLVGAGILPLIAEHWRQADPALRAALEVDFMLWDRFSVLLTGLVGNLFYALGGFGLMAICARSPGFPRWLVWLQLPLWTATLGICVATVADSVPGLVVSVAITMTLFCVWCSGVAMRWLGR